MRALFVRAGLRHKAAWQRGITEKPPRNFRSKEAYLMTVS